MPPPGGIAAGEPRRPLLTPPPVMDLLRLSSAFLLLPLITASCASTEAQAPEPIAGEAKASVETQELDPNDPNVEQCPVTGALQLKSASGKSSH